MSDKKIKDIQPVETLKYINDNREKLYDWVRGQNIKHIYPNKQEIFKVNAEFSNCLERCCLFKCQIEKSTESLMAHKYKMQIFKYSIIGLPKEKNIVSAALRSKMKDMLITYFLFGQKTKLKPIAECDLGVHIINGFCILKGRLPKFKKDKFNILVLNDDYFKVDEVKDFYPGKTLYTIKSICKIEVN